MRQEENEDKKFVPARGVVLKPEYKLPLIARGKVTDTPQTDKPLPPVDRLEIRHDNQRRLKAFKRQNPA